MSASPDATTYRPSRGPVVVIVALALVWIGFLAWLVVNSANPIVVNAVQVRHADLIAQGHWIPGDPPQLSLDRSWKAEAPQKPIFVRPMKGLNPTGRVIMPLTRVSPDLYEVTSGELLNPPEKLDPAQKPRLSHVRPLVYPATPDVIRQIESLLDAPPAR